LAQARRTKTTTSSENTAVIATQLQRGLREGAMLVLMALSLFLFTALITYNSADPGWLRRPRLVLYRHQRIHP